MPLRRTISKEGFKSSLASQALDAEKSYTLKNVKDDDLFHPASCGAKFLSAKLKSESRCIPWAVRRIEG